MRPSSGEILKNEYRRRISSVINYIHQHYGEELNLDKLAKMVNMSKYHFHRIFKSVAGETAGDFIRRIRLKESVDKLMLSPNKSITEIALECGYSTSQNFTKMFKTSTGISPSLFRREYNWRSWCEKMMRLKVKKQGDNLSFWEIPLFNEYSNRYPLLSGEAADQENRLDVKVIEKTDLYVAYIRSIGLDTIKECFQRLIEWAIPRGILREDTIVLTTAWSLRNRTPDDKLILDACISVPESVPADRWVNVQTLPGGLYAVYRCEAEPDNREPQWMAFTFNWLLTSIYQPDSRPLYEIFCPETFDHPHGLHVLDLCLPVKSLYD